MNKQRYPTFISFGPSGKSGQVPALKMFLEQYSLTTISVLCESLFNYLNLAAYFGVIGRGIKSLLMTSQNFTVSYQDIDSVRLPEYETMLLKAKRLSRVIILETREDIVRKIMVRSPKVIRVIV
ncbi:hypothetical protein RvY_13276-2 [Ramazzottius varieornatus]|uniref:Receptor ligand binding region domain-containing protein n=1 Tax=Ramazzottius varieornatus TaxID=947166 RepID=A0A1D1VMA5_RAMVA|nr:hypothetical protein RvY_13276-2 [Ramazzottius varieornatus]